MPMGIATSTLKHLPCSAAMIYLLLGYLLGLPGAGLLRIVTEIALLVSLFAIGLRLRVPLRDRLWALPWRLGAVATAITEPLLAAFSAFARHFRRSAC